MRTSPISSTECSVMRLGHGGRRSPLSGTVTVTREVIGPVGWKLTARVARDLGQSS